MLLVADFETNTLSEKEEQLYREGKLKAKDLKTNVWGWGMVEVGKVKDEDILIGNSLDSFMKTVLSLANENPKIYFHNLKFDGHFIISWLLNNGYKMVEDRKHATHNSFHTLISDNGLFYSINVVVKRYKSKRIQIQFLDSMKKLPFSVDRIAKAFHLDFKKVEVDESFYTKYRDENHELTQLEIEYIQNDIRVISQALQILFHQGMEKMTIGSDALYNYKLSIGGEKYFRSIFPVLSHDEDDDIKYAYRGGVTMVKEEVRSKDIGVGKTYDINSMYPYIMRYKKLPYDKPIFYKGKYVENEEYDLYIQQFKCEFKLKEGYLPTIQIKDRIGVYSPREYIRESKGLTTLHLTNVDLDLFFEHYDVWNIEWDCGYMFKSSNKYFINYIDHWTEVKENSTGAMRELAKLMLNSLYGKFGTKTVVQGKHPYLNEHGIVKMKLGESERIDPVYSAVAVFTTSYGRDIILRTAQANYDRFLYCDTDSIHVLGTETPKMVKLHPTKLGYWDDEGTFTRARFLGAKCYIEDFEESGLKVTCAGMTKDQHKQVTYDNFHFGLVVKGKLQPKIVKGGVVLVNTDYEVKVRGFIR